jgi:hypothetical protein
LVFFEFEFLQSEYFSNLNILNLLKVEFFSNLNRKRETIHFIGLYLVRPKRPRRKATRRRDSIPSRNGWSIGARGVGLVPMVARPEVSGAGGWTLPASEIFFYLLII